MKIVVHRMQGKQQINYIFFINLHRKGKIGVPHRTEHFNSCYKRYKNVVYGNNENGIVVENIRRLRLAREGVWMETLKRNFP